MRILKIELQNINSLKSDTPVVIDFESDKFRDIGLFAITGATGAGKTTILDAVTIAMYHSVPRFNKSNIKAGLEDVVSYGANNAMARVTFDNKNVRYEAQWNIRLATKNGKRLTNPKEEVRLKNLSAGKIISEKKREVQLKIEEITQLNYDQFLRSVMLTQGEFAAFLSANAKDKGTLLEQITGEEIYKKIGEAINNKKSAEIKKLYEIKAKINYEDLMTDEKRKKLYEEKNYLTEKINALDKDFKQTDRIINWFKKNAELRKTQLQLEKEKVNLEKEKEKKLSILKILDAHEKAEPFKEAIDEITRLEKETIKKKEQIEKLNIELETDIAKLSETLIQKNKSKETFLKNESELKFWLPKLEQITKLDTEIANIFKTKEKTEEKIKEISESIKIILKNIKEKEIEQNQKEKELIKIELFLKENKNAPEIEKHLADWSSSLTVRKNNRDRISEESNLIIKTEKDFKIINEKLEKDELKFQLENKKIEKLKEELKDISKQLETFDLENFLEKQNHLETQKDKINELKILSENYINSNKILTDLSKEKNEFEEKIKKLNEEVFDLKNEIGGAGKTLIDAENILELERTIKSLEEERKKLEKGKACSLCGSTEHPFVEKYAKIELSKSQAEVKTRKTLLEKLKKNEKRIEINITEIKTKLEANLTQTKICKQQIEDIQDKFNKNNSDFKIEDIKIIKDEFEELNAKLKKLSEEIKETQNLQKQKDAKDKFLNSEKEKVNNLEKEIVKLKEKSANLAATLLQAKEDFKKISLETEVMETSLKKELTEFDLTLFSTEKTAEFIKQLETKISSFHRKSKELSEVKNAISQLKLDIKNSKNQQKEKTSEKEKLDGEIKKLGDKLSQHSENRNLILPKKITTDSKREELQKTIKISKEKSEKITDEFNNLKTKKVTKEKEKENLEIEQTDKQKDLKTKFSDLNEKVRSSSFESKYEIEKSLLSFDDKTKFSEIRKLLETETLELKTLVAKLEEDFNKQEQEKDFEVSHEESLEKFAEIKSNREQFLERTGEIKKQFELDNQIKERNKGVFEKIDNQEIVLKKWTDLINLLGGSKHAFNTYVQRLTLQNLIQLANIHLYKLNQRYSLKMNEKYSFGEELNFNLIDHYQTDDARLVDTSSGGEKFLISLALALGLSDLASNTVNIESLFIDEGFGTLDSNALETVISTLETLQAQGKMIGIISHIENLKERIPTQIQVLKKRNGVSEVEIV